MSRGTGRPRQTVTQFSAVSHTTAVVPGDPGAPTAGSARAHIGEPGPHGSRTSQDHKARRDGTLALPDGWSGGRCVALGLARPRTNGRR